MKVCVRNWNHPIQVHRLDSHKRYDLLRFLRLTTTLTAIAMIISISGLALAQSISAGVTLAARFARASSGRTSGSVGAAPERLREHSRRRLSANQASVSFGSIAVGSTGSQSLTLTNSGTASITISSVGVSGTGFSIAGLSTPMTLSAGQSASFSAAFTPSSAGNASGSISIAQRRLGFSHDDCVEWNWDAAAMERPPDERELRQRQRGKQFFAKCHGDQLWNCRVDDFVDDIVWSRVQHQWTSCAPNHRCRCKCHICGAICARIGGQHFGKYLG